MAPSFDPFDPEYLDDPYPTFDELRRSQPVAHNAELDYWILSRYVDVRTAFRDATRFSASNALTPMQPRSATAAAILRDGYRSVPTLTNADPPAHTRVRRLANVAFTPRMVSELEPFVRDLAVRMIEEGLHGPDVDVVHALTWELPALVIFKILGVSEEDVPQVKAWGANRLMFLFGRTDDATQAEVAEGMVAFWRYTEDLVRERSAHPRADFTSELVLAEGADGQRLTHTEVATILFGLLLAGHESTTHLLSNAIRRLLEDRASAWRLVCGDASLIPNAVEETLRFDPPVVVWRRKTRVPVVLHNVHIPAESNLLLLIGSANRDESVFTAAETFDVCRPNARDHLSFGMGNHLCLGAPLARLEARVVLEELTRRCPDLDLVPDQRLEFPRQIAFRGPNELHVSGSTLAPSAEGRCPVHASRLDGAINVAGPA
jgi:hypothetical protein